MSFQLKTIFGIAIIEALMLGFLILTITNILERTKAEELVHHATNTAHLFATTTKDSVLTSDLAALDSFVEEVMKNRQLLYARVVASDDLVMAEKHRTLASQHIKFIQDYALSDIQDGSFDTAAPIAEAGYEYGRVELGFSVDEVANVVSDAQEKALLIASFELLVSALFSSILGFYLTRQLRTLKHAAKVVASGDFSIQLPEQGNDEIGVTVRAFNRMSQRLNQSWQELDLANSQLTELNVALENKVRERTQELERTQSEALKVAHRAGMADIAAGAVHNIGNVINSAKTDVTLALKAFDTLAVNKLTKANELLVQKVESPDVVAAEMADIVDYYAVLEKSLSRQSEEVLRFLKSIKNHVDKTEAIVADQQATAKYAQVVLHETCLQELTIQVFESIESICARNNIRTHLVCVGDPILVAVQANKVHQILLNLCMNAVDAIKTMPIAVDDAKLEVRERLIQVTLDYGAVLDAGFLDILIQDSGLGVAENLRDKIFQSGYTTKSKGNGFGLHSCATLAVEMKGELLLLPAAKGWGAEFNFKLPVNTSS